MHRTTSFFSTALVVGIAGGTAVAAVLGLLRCDIPFYFWLVAPIATVVAIMLPVWLIGRFTKPPPGSSDRGTESAR